MREEGGEVGREGEGRGWGGWGGGGGGGGGVGGVWVCFSSGGELKWTNTHQEKKREREDPSPDLAKLQVISCKNTSIRQHLRIHWTVTTVHL